MNKPRIVINWTKLHPNDLVKYNGREQPIYKLFLPWDKVIYPWNGEEGPCVSTCNPNDCLAMIICRDFEIDRRMELGNNSYVWTDDNWIPVIGTTPKWPSYSSGMIYQNDK